MEKTVVVVPEGFFSRNEKNANGHPSFLYSFDPLIPRELAPLERQLLRRKVCPLSILNPSDKRFRGWEVDNVSFKRMQKIGPGNKFWVPPKVI